MVNRILVVALLLVACLDASRCLAAETLSDTAPLKLEGDIASAMIDGADRFLLNQIEQSVAHREKFWKRNLSSQPKYLRSVHPNRKRLAEIVGLVDSRVPFDALELVATTTQPALIAKTDTYDVFAVRWPVLAGVYGEGLLLKPNNRTAIANVVAVPDCNQTPEQIAGLDASQSAGAPYARRLAESGCCVLVPVLIDRQEKLPGLQNREWLYRSSFELGRGIIAYEIQKILAGVDWFGREAPQVPIGVVGWGEGGLLALYSAALDTRIRSTWVSGYFADRNQLWQEPIDRNLFGLLEQFGDAELATLIAPRSLIVEAAAAPETTIRGVLAAPARVVTPALTEVRKEIARAEKLTAGLTPKPWVQLIVSGDQGRGPYGTDRSLRLFLVALSPNAELAPPGLVPRVLGKLPHARDRLARQLRELDDYNQRLLADSRTTRQRIFWDRLRYGSPDEFTTSTKPLREKFATDMIGVFDEPRLALNPRTRQIEKNDRWTRYEVVLDVYPNVIAYGLLTIPNDIRSGERRPVVVCQHGLEGRPQSTISAKDRPTYKAFASELADRGFITFAPQNPYIFGDRFRTLQRKANPLKKTLYSLILAQHQQIVAWLKSRPEVDGDRIAFYGISYGGKVALRLPPLIPEYAVVICSGDFNDWADKTASTHSSYSYTVRSEYEMFEFALANTFSHAEMVALIAPRPFMVERGHGDRVAADETVAAEYAAVRRLYDAKLHLPEQTTIEWFDGPHKINGQGTYAFLHNQLNWPPPKEK